MSPKLEACVTLSEQTAVTETSEIGHKMNSFLGRGLCKEPTHITVPRLHDGHGI